MSSKTTILLTDNNEHWYIDCKEKVIILEFSKDNVVRATGDKVEIVIKPDSALYKELENVRI